MIHQQSNTCTVQTVWLQFVLFVAVFAQEVTEGASVGGSDQSGPAGGAGEKAPSGAARTTGFPHTAAARIHNW